MMKMCRMMAVCVVCGVLSLSSLASADELFATLGEPLTEVAHEVDVTFKDGGARYRVRRTFHNAGARHEEAVLSLRLPPGAAAVGLRIRAEDKWYDGELMEAERAEQLYQELTGIGPHTPRDPALLAWSWADELLLRVFPVPPGGIATVEYTLVAQASYTQGEYSLWYPQASEGLAQVTMRVEPEAGRIVRVDGRRFPAQTAIPLAQLAPDPRCELALAEQGISGSCVLSDVEMPERPGAGSVRVRARIKHTWRSDLVVSLRSPDGRWAAIVDNQGGRDNNLVIDRELVLPYGISVAGTWTLLVSDTVGRDVGVLESWSLEAGAHEEASVQVPQVIPDSPDGAGERMAMVSLDAPRIQGGVGRLGRVVAGPDHQLTSLAVDIAPKLSELPKEAAVVFVLDASISIGADAIEAQLRTIQAYMGHVPDARAEIVVVRRVAAPLFGAFVPSGELEARLSSAREAGLLEAGNGSALDEGAALAAKLLKAERGVKRIVLFSDLLARPSLTTAMGVETLAGLGKDVVVHLIAPEANEDVPSLERDDTEAWSALATRHGGIFARLRGLGGEEAPKGLGAVVLGLVRPLQIDGVVVEGLALSEGAREELPNSLREGEGLRYFGWVKSAPQRVVVRGKLWSAPFKVSINATDAESRLAAAFIFARDEFQDLSREEQLKVAFYGRVVSPVTSYLAIEPGVRPSFAGLDRMSGMGMGGRGFGAGGMSGGGHSVSSQDLLDGAWRRCDGERLKTHPITITVHTTRREIVDVESAQRAEPLVQCLIEEIWALALPWSYQARARDVLVARW
jgi:subtilisin-like proprotein convertase family protein